MPPESYIYALPYEYYTKHGIRRYGFHGTSHKYVAERAAEILNVDIEDLKLITCHLGNGASVSCLLYTSRAQQNAVREIMTDMESENAMSRLVQGLSLIHIYQ